MKKEKAKNSEGGKKNGSASKPHCKRFYLTPNEKDWGGAKKDVTSKKPGRGPRIVWGRK